MNLRSLKLASAAAGLLFLVGAAPNVFAQSTAVLNLKELVTSGFRSADFYSTFTLNRSMILNSVGFVPYSLASSDVADYNFFYKIGTEEEIEITNGTILSSLDASGVRYLTFDNPQTYAAGTEVRIRSQFSNGQYLFRQIISTNSVGVTHTSSTSGFATGNIKVSEPGSNVAPEPGSIALLLTGGGALAGIALRRRRNAA
jgi:hypothetical protein